MLYPLIIQEMSRKGSAQYWTDFFTDSKTELGLFLPQAQWMNEWMNEDFISGNMMVEVQH